jgi:hypothetical protein
LICVGGKADGAEFCHDGAPPKFLHVVNIARDEFQIMEVPNDTFDLYEYKGRKGEDPAIFLYDHEGRF